VRHVRAEAWASLRRLGRNRLALSLVLLLPLLFFAAVLITTPRRLATVELASVPESEMVMPPVVPIHPAPRGAVLEAPERSLGAVFIAIAAVGAVAALLALDLVQKDTAATRRLVLCGRRPAEILAGRLMALACVLALATACVAAVLPALVDAERFGLMVAGLLLGALVHAAYGLLVGAIFRRELVGVLLVVLLVNLDAGWLQNPLYYAGAQHRLVIRLLPAHGPAQVALVAALSDYPVGRAGLLGLGHALAMLVAAGVVFTIRARVARRSRAGDLAAGPEDGRAGP
jgi:hypothetical protein